MLSVSANNHTDTGFSFNFSMPDQWVATNFRAKFDDSSSYMYCQSGNVTYSARVWAGDIDACAFDVSHGYYYTLYAGNRAFLRNWAYENGFPVAGIV